MQLIIVFRAVLASFHNYHLLVEEKPYLIQLYQFGGPLCEMGREITWQKAFCNIYWFR